MNWKTAWLSAIVLAFPLMAAAYDDIYIDASLDDSTKTLSGTVEIRFSDYAPGADRWLFRLYPNVQCTSSDTVCGLQVDSAWVDDIDITSSLVGTGTYISVLRPADHPGRDTTVVRLKFALNMLKPGKRTGYKNGQYLLEGWFPIPTLWRDSSWVYTAYAEQSEPTADLFDITARIHIPESLQYIAPSTQMIAATDGMKLWETQLPGVDDIGAVIGVGYHEDASVIDGVRLSVWSRPNDKWVVPSVKQSISAALSFMAGEGLPYPYDEKVVVIGGLNMGAGLELPRMTAIVPPLRPTISHNYLGTIVHEIVHQWFYGLVNNDQAADPMLDESVTEYFTQRIMHATYGANSLLNNFGFTSSVQTPERIWNRLYVERVPIDRPSAEYFDQFEYYAAVYYKGTPTIAFLCGLMGKDAERKFWRTWVDTYRDRMPSTQDFFTLADQFLPDGRPGLTREIVQSTSRLDLAIADVKAVPVEVSDSSSTDSAAPGTEFTNTVDYTLQNHFGLRVPLRLWYADGSVIDTSLKTTAGQHRFVIRSHVPLRAAQLDPEQIFRTDINYLNNGMTVGESSSAALRLFSGITFLIQSLLSTAWGW